MMRPPGDRQPGCGEQVPPDLLNDLQALFKHARLWVLYGPTEATIMCTQYAVPHGQQLNGHPIGAPLDNVSIRLCNRQRELVPIGVRGELYIGGAGVTRG